MELGGVLLSTSRGEKEKGGKRTGVRRRRSFSLPVHAEGLGLSRKITPAGKKVGRKTDSVLRLDTRKKVRIGIRGKERKGGRGGEIGETERGRK